MKSQADQYEYNHLEVPRDPELNKLWRQETLRLAGLRHEKASVFRKQIMDKCAKDFFYWSTGFCYLFEPRMLDDDVDLQSFETAVPYLPWSHQIPVIDRILKVLGKRDIRVVKSRAQGASWIIVLVFVWAWLFKKGFKGNLVSKDEKAVDRRNDMDSLMGKMDFLLDKLPDWMTGNLGKHYRRNYGEHTLAKMDGQTAITGYACTGDVASGGRALVFAMDELAKHPRGPDREALASTQPITRCRLFISTPKGNHGAYHDIVHDDTIEEPILYLSWRDNETQNRGLYTIVRGKPRAVDAEKYGPLPAEYHDHEKWEELKTRLKERGFDLSADQTRSPWYDQECLRPGANPVLVAQEYDMQFGAEGAAYFAGPLINRLHERVVRPQRFEFHVDPESLHGKLTPHEDGRFKVWCPIDITHSPPMGDYIVAADIAAGVGGSSTSNSAVSVFDRQKGKKVLGFASPSTLPFDLAEICVALANLFVDHRGDPAFMIWESNNYGGEFGQRVQRANFHNFYRRKTKDAPIHMRSTNKPGYHTYKRSVLLGPYREALLQGYFDNPDYDAVEELREYQMGEDGEPYHVGEKDKTDPAGAKAAHGDRVIADALIWEAVANFGDQMDSAIKKQKISVMNVRSDQVARNSYAWRRAQYLEQMRKQKAQKSNW